jgi:hypothetical protein
MRTSLIAITLAAVSAMALPTTQSERMQRNLMKRQSVTASPLQTPALSFSLPSFLSASTTVQTHAITLNHSVPTLSSFLLPPSSFNPLGICIEHFDFGNYVAASKNGPIANANALTSAYFFV